MLGERVAYGLLIISLVGAVSLQAVEINQRRAEVKDLQEEVHTLAREVSTREAELEQAYTDLLGRWEDFEEDATEWTVEEFRITGYAPFDDPAGLCSDGDPTTTRSGTYPTEGRTVAVDPNVIPLGTPLWVEGYGWRMAEDTGGAVRGNHVDVMVDDRAKALQIHGEAVVIYPEEGGGY